MTTAIDSNVLIDVIGRPNEFTAARIRALDTALRSGALITCPIVAAETAAWFESTEEFKRAYASMQILLVAFGWQDLHAAGLAYVRHCKRSRGPKGRMLADFLVAAHACAHADALLTWDRGHYKTYFPKLKLVAPQDAA
jgi:predicted nucleic acid-binding protein